MKIYVQKGQNVQQNNTKKYVFLSLAAIFLISAGVWFKFAGRTAIYDLRNSADATREGLKSAEDEQRDQAAALDRAENAADRSQSAIRDSEERADRVQELERSDAEIIRESQSILDRVRERGKKEN